MTATHIPQLTIEPAADGQSVSLQQDAGGSRHCITLHVSQVRAIAGILGLDRPDDCLKRSLLHAHALAARLHQHLVLIDGTGHEDLTMEVMEALALADFLSFQCHEFASEFEVVARTPVEALADPAIAPRAARVSRVVPAPIPLKAGAASSGELFDQGALHG